MNYITNLLLRKNNISFDKEELFFQIQSHPSYPSLYAITAVFNHFNIEHVAAKVASTKDTFNQLPKSFIAQINNEKKSELIVVEKYKQQCKLYHDNKKVTTVTVETFLKKFTGVLLAVEKEEISNNLKIKNVNLTTIGQVSAAIGLFTLFYNASVNLDYYIYLLISIIGILASIAILKQESGINTVIGNAFCSSDSEKKDCNTVLESKGATLFKNYKLSDLSLIYFIGLSTSIILLTLQGLSLNVIYAMTVFAFSISFYSIYYQAFIVKTWCLLCLSIVAILCIQVLIPFFNQFFSSSFEFKISEGLTILTSFVFVLTTYNYLKTKYIEAEENRKLKIAYFKFKNNFSLFSSILKSSEPTQTTIKNSLDIVFGNKNAAIEIVVVTNPFCGYCKPVHELVENILVKYSEKVKITVRFNISLSKITNEAFIICANLLDIYKTQGEDKAKKAMTEAYSINSKDWIRKWGKDDTINLNDYKQTLAAQKNWCVNNNINFTPEILINGHVFPKEYQHKDLMFLIEEFNDAFNADSKVVSPLTA